MNVFFSFFIKISETDREFEIRISALDVDSNVRNEMINQARDHNLSLQEQMEKLKEVLRKRKDRKKPVKLSEEELKGLSEEEQHILIEARELQNEADREKEDKALLEGRKLFEEVVSFCFDILTLRGDFSF